MTNSFVDKLDKFFLNKFIKNISIYPLFIFIIWLVTYIFYTVVWEQKLGWDEISYLTTARGIAEDFDFSGRSNSVQGLIKYPFPQNTHHYPVYSTYIAIFFKLFGTSLEVAYFSTWLAALFACIFIYLTLLLMTENNRLLSFLFSISFLFFPRIPDSCDSAMMEIPGCALISILTFFIFKQIVKGKVNPIMFGIVGIWLFFFKSLLIGTLFGLTTLILAAFNFKFSNLKVLSKMPWYVNLISFFGVFVLLYLIFTKLIFLPLAPMMNFNPKTEVPEGTYADFLGGFLNDVCGNLSQNIQIFLSNTFGYYYPIYGMFYEGRESFYVLIPAWFELAIYFLTFLSIAGFSILMWKKFLPHQRLFIVFTLVSIFFFNLIFALLFGGGYGLISRYNQMYLPLLVISLGIIVSVVRNQISSFVSEYKKGLCFLILLFFFLIDFSLYYSANFTTQWDKNYYHNLGQTNSNIVRKYVGDSRPMFVYFNIGQHTTWNLYPTRVILMEATNKQIKKLNSKLPKPIEYLFLQPTNNLFKENQALILNGKPIIDNWYTFYGLDSVNKVIVYKYNPHPITGQYEKS